MGVGTARGLVGVASTHLSEALICWAYEWTAPCSSCSVHNAAHRCFHASGHRSFRAARASATHILQRSVPALLRPPVPAQRPPIHAAHCAVQRSGALWKRWHCVGAPAAARLAAAAAAAAAAVAAAAAAAAAARPLGHLAAPGSPQPSSHLLLSPLCYCSATAGAVQGTRAAPVQWCIRRQEVMGGRKIGSHTHQYSETIHIPRTSASGRSTCSCASCAARRQLWSCSM